MINTEQARHWWTWLRQRALQEPSRAITAYKHAVPHPRDAGAHVSVGLPVGQDQDFRFPPEHDCRGVHVQSFGFAWLIHVDEVHPACGPAEHLRRDAPGTWVAAATAVGGMVGLLLGRKAEGALAGAVLGALMGALTAAIPPQRRLGR